MSLLSEEYPNYKLPPYRSEAEQQFSCIAQAWFRQRKLTKRIPRPSLDHIGADMFDLDFAAIKRVKEYAIRSLLVTRTRDRIPPLTRRRINPELNLTNTYAQDQS